MIELHGDLGRAQALQAALLADVRRLSEMNDVLLAFYQEARLPKGLYCNSKTCSICDREREVRRLLRER